MKRLAFAFLALVVAAAAGVGSFLLWIHAAASRKGEPDRHADLYVPPAPARVPEGRAPMFSVARVGDRWRVVDHEGRVVVWRGLNLLLTREGDSFGPIPAGDTDTLVRLRRTGVDAIRLLVPWSVLEPRPRSFCIDCIPYLRWLLDQCERLGITVLLLNHHQWVSECMGGVGAPAWAHRPGIAAPVPGGDACLAAAPPGIGALPAFLRWWADFWDASWTPDDLALQDHVNWTFTKLAEVVRTRGALAGYGAMHRPWCPAGPPLSWVYPGESDCANALARFDRNFAGSILSKDPDALLFFETPADQWSTVPGRRGVMVTGCCVPGDGDPGDLLWGPFRRHASPAVVFERTVSTARSRDGTAAIVGWLGFDAGPCALAEALDMADEHMVSVFAWIREDDDRGPSLPALRFLDPENAATAFAQFVRPYPERIAGIPVSWSFDGKNGTFRLVFTEAGTRGKTLVRVPRRLVYGEDESTEAPEFTIDVSDGRWAWSPRDPDLLEWTTRPGKSEHVLVIRPWGGTLPHRTVPHCNTAGPGDPLAVQGEEP